ncbi:class III lanthipeptide [Staphylococcus hominis]|nr:class III lanthipeptide [Staphylococcus hominis]MCI2887569.1 class III lanthipeptide [Staphylococcus hominis]
MNKNEVLNLQGMRTKKSSNYQASNASVMCKKQSSASIFFCVFRGDK